ncbi:MAG: type II secretion system major pseudopilin GspG [Candidatus Brocadiaceae bacterium]|nr:type II secretion system major pseudopilin GspG [Candidatus Brocadiaceae bacterium]
MKQSVIRTSFSQEGKKVSGFTLIELLIVLFIIGLLAAIVLPKLIGKVDDSKITATKAQIELISTALDMYKLDTGKYPSQGSGLGALNTKADDVDNWNGPYLKKEKVPKDPWGADYVYKYPGEHGDFDIVSYGADKAEGGDGDNKDIVSWE